MNPFFSRDVWIHIANFKVSPNLASLASFGVITSTRSSGTRTMTFGAKLKF